ncbi:hypothetical protein HYV64_05120 [Candidatus Shapirobacteria bacterium]|nr:hypothetical protein [Candidatus Shapirobacteria bacterium]
MKNLPENLVIPVEPTAEEMVAMQKKFDGIFRKVLVACDNITFGTPVSEKKFAKYLGGRDQVEIYYQMRSQLPDLKIKTGAQLGIRTRLNG